MHSSPATSTKARSSGLKETAAELDAQYVASGDEEIGFLPGQTIAKILAPTLSNQSSNSCRAVMVVSI